MGSEVAFTGQRGVRMTSREVVDEYGRGRRDFTYVEVVNAVFSGMNLEGIRFYGARLPGADFAGTSLLYAQFKDADLTEADFTGSTLAVSDLIGARFRGTVFHRVDFTGAALDGADCTDADFRGAFLNSVKVEGAHFSGASFDGARLSRANLSNTDLGALCGARNLRHDNPCSIDAHAVMKSYGHPELYKFMLRCGVPALFAESMIDCARTLGE